MPIDQAVTPDEWVPLARAALRHAPRTMFIELFPHLERVAREPVAGHVPISTRLANILSAWHGRLWLLYLLETPASLRARRYAGERVVGEFIGVAIAAAERPIAPVSSAVAETAPAAEPSRPTTDHLDDVDPILARLRGLEGPPPRPDLREAARSLLRSVPDVPLDELFPELVDGADETIDVRTAAAHFLPSLLGRWHGSSWSPYHRETAASVHRRRHGGLITTGALLWLAARRSAVTRPNQDTARRRAARPAPDRVKLRRGATPTGSADR
jgi:hypothetical protein